MNDVKSEWPLVVFTVCAPLCAGAWVVAALLSVTGVLPDASVLTTGWHGFALCAVLLGALACSTLHLGKPLKALRAFKRLGNSAVSSEVFMGGLFAAASVLYVSIAQGLMVESGLWKIMLVLVAAFAALFVVFQCLAYRMRTVPTWNSFPFSIEFALVALLGGLCLEGVVACATLPVSHEVRLALVVAEAVCCVSLIAVVYAQGTVVAEGVSARRDSRIFLRRWNEIGAVRVLMVAAGSVVWGCGMLVGEPSVGFSSLGLLFVLIGIVVGRCAFYRFYVNVGLRRG